MYKEYTVSIPFKEDDPLYLEIAEFAKQKNSNFDTELSFLVHFGLNYHLKENLKLAIISHKASEYKKLLDDGIITEAEFEEKKRELLGPKPKRE